MTICQQEEREAGRAYPRTCPTCRLGPCQKYGGTPLATLDALRAENARLRRALEAIIETDRVYGVTLGSGEREVWHDGDSGAIARAALAQKEGEA